MARRLFDDGIFSVIAPSGGVGVGWLLNFYTAGTTTRIITYNDGDAGSANPNPVPADANGRFGQVWIADNQAIKWVLTDANGVVQATLDNIGIEATQTAPDVSLTSFLSAAAPLPIANGGTASTSAVNALAALGALPLTGGTVTGNIVRSGKGIHPYFSNASMTSGKIFIQAAGADPTSAAGDIVFEY